MPLPWFSLEHLPSLRAIPRVWREQLGDDFEIFQAALLQKLPEPAPGIFCDKCYCTHEVIPDSPAPTHSNSAFQTPHSAVACPSLPPLLAVCRCDDRTCPAIPLTLADIEQWSLSWSRLARALCKAFGLNSRFTDLKLFNTYQIGTWSADAVPVILTIQSERHQLSTIISQLTSRLRHPFILLAPTTENLDALGQEFMANAGAEFFALENIVRLTESGTLLALKAPGELFAKFSPEEKLPDDDALRAFAIARSLDSEEGIRTAPVFTVFRLYCMENLSVEQVAKRLHCSKATIINRLRALGKKTGTNPENLRAYSAQFSSIEDSLSDSRARRIHRQSAIYDESPAEEE